MSGCSGIRADGGRCRAQAIRGNQWCVNHHPDYAEARRRRASKGGKRGGRGRPVVEIGHIKDQLADLYESVLEGQVEPKVAAVASQIANVRTRLVETELKVKEQQELEERLEQLEEALERQRGGNRWGV
jgi:hypothetical protein